MKITTLEGTFLDPPGSTLFFTKGVPFGCILIAKKASFQKIVNFFQNLKFTKCTK